MRRQLTGTLVATAALLLPATAAAEPLPMTQSPTTTTQLYAQAFGIFITVDPRQAVPGATVAMTTGCPVGDNPALTSPALTRIKPVKPPFGWNATVRNVAPGEYPVNLTCPNWGHSFSTTLTVLAPPPAPPKQKKPQVPVKPKGAPQTGGGGTS